MTARVAELIAELKANPPPLPVDEIAEAVQFLEWLLADNFTFLGIRDYHFSAGADAPRADVRERARRPAHAQDAGAASAATGRSSITPEIRAFLNEPTLLIVTKANVRSRVHRRVYMDYVGVKRFDADGKLIGEFRIVGLFTSTAYTRSTRTIPYLRRKVDAVHQPRRLRSRRPFRQGAGQRAGDLSARRAVPDRRGHALPVRAGDPAARRAAARARAAAPRPVRPLRLGPRLRAARPLRQRRAQGDRRLSRRGLCTGRLSAFYPFFPEGPLVRVHFIIGRVGGRDAEPRPRRRWSRRSARSCAPGRDALADALAQTLRAGQGARAARALPRRLLGRLSRGLSAGRPPSPTSG